MRSLCKVQHIPPIDIRDAVRDIRNIALKLMEDLDESMYKRPRRYAASSIKR